MAWPEPVTLRTSRATLAPLDLSHHDRLVEAVNDGELWKLWYTRIPRPSEMRAEIARRLGHQRRGSMPPFTMFENASGKAVGMTSYMNIDAASQRVEVGSTWYRRSDQRTSGSTECKRGRLTHA